MSILNFETIEEANEAYALIYRKDEEARKVADAMYRGALVRAKTSYDLAVVRAQKVHTAAIDEIYSYTESALELVNAGRRNFVDCPATE